VESRRVGVICSDIWVQLCKHALPGDCGAFGTYIWMYCEGNHRRRSSYACICKISSLVGGYRYGVLWGASSGAWVQLCKHSFPSDSVACVIHIRIYCDRNRYRRSPHSRLGELGGQGGLPHTRVALRHMLRYMGPTLQARIAGRLRGLWDIYLDVL